jgi:hypothetical protein
VFWRALNLLQCDQVEANADLILKECAYRHEVIEEQADLGAG